MALRKDSPCKVNLLLNILGRRPDGFHELETVFQPIQLCDRLDFALEGSRLALTCSDASLSTDAGNLVYRAAIAFLKAAHIRDGVRLHLEKRIPLAAGLGGGSGNAATTLLGLNELFDRPLAEPKLHELASALGSDVPFFLQSKPALAKGTARAAGTVSGVARQGVPVDPSRLWHFHAVGVPKPCAVS